MSGLGSCGERSRERRGRRGENDERNGMESVEGSRSRPLFPRRGERLLPSVGLLARGSCCAPSPFPEAAVVDVQPRVVWELASPVTVAGPRRLFTGLPFYALTGTESIFYLVVRKQTLPPSFCGECQGEPRPPRNGSVANRSRRRRKPGVTGARRIDPSGCGRPATTVRETRSGKSCIGWAAERDPDDTTTIACARALLLSDDESIV
jgi:hypothetical protein